MNKLDTFALMSEDLELVRTASSLILNRGKYGRHHVASALKTTDGRHFLGLHISANFGVGSICAEAAAIAEAQKERHSLIDKIVSVRHTFDSINQTEVVSPCGRCRHLILEYGPNALVVLLISQELFLVPISQLLPMPFVRKKRGNPNHDHL